MNESDDDQPSCLMVAEILQELRDQYPCESFEKLQERFNIRAKSKPIIHAIVHTDVFERTCIELYNECLRDGRPIPNMLRKP